MSAPQYIVKVQIDDATLKKQINLLNTVFKSAFQKNTNEFIKVIKTAHQEFSGIYKAETKALTRNLRADTKVMYKAIERSNIEAIKVTIREVQRVSRSFPKGGIFGGVKQGKIVKGGIDESEYGSGAPQITPNNAMPIFNLSTKSVQSLSEKLKESFGSIMSGDFMEKLPNVLKIGGILAGIASLTALITKMVEVSPVLQAVLKMLNLMITLFLMPIGTFIGLVLRPFVMLAIRHMIPWFKKAMAVANGAGKLADQVAETSDTPLTNVFPTLQDIQPNTTSEGYEVHNFDDFVKKLQNAVDGINKFFTIPEASGDTGKTDVSLSDPNADAWKAINDFFSKASDDITSTLSTAWDSTVSFFTSLGNNETLKTAWDTAVSFFTDVASKINETLTSSWYTFVTFIGMFGSVIDNIISPAWNTLVGFFDTVNAVIGSTITTAWNSLVSFFTVMFGDLSSVLNKAWDKLYGWFSDIYSDITSTLNTTWDNVYKFFKTIESYVSSIADGIKNAYNKIRSMLDKIGLGGLLGSSKAYANGGLITEPIMGIGQRTGQSYQLGERGSEYVIPANRMGMGSVPQVNITLNVGSVSNQMDLDKMKREIVKIVEDTVNKVSARRGIL